MYDSADGSLWGGGGSKFHGGRRERKWEGRRITLLWDSSRASACEFTLSPAQHDEEVLSGPQLRGWTWPQPQLDSGHVHRQVHRALSQLTVARKPKWGLWFKMAQ